MMKYSITVTPCFDGIHYDAHNVCSTELWDIAIDAANYCMRSYADAYDRFRVQIISATNGRSYASWEVFHEHGTLSVLGSCPDGECRIAEPA